MNLEHLFHDLSHRRQGIEFAALHRSEQPLQLWIISYRTLQMHLCPRAGNREDLAGEVLRAPLGEMAAFLQIPPVPLDLCPEVLDPLPAHRLRAHDRRLPLPLRVEREDGA